MAQQKISTPSVINVIDTVIRSSSAYAFPEVGGIQTKDPWDTVLNKLSPYALDPDTLVAALRNSLSNPSSVNPFITESLYEKRFGIRAFVLVGPEGSNADFEGLDEETISSALTSLGPNGGWVVLLPAVYTISSTLTLPENTRLMGTHPETTILQTTADIVGVSLSQNTLLSRVTIEGSASITTASVVINANSTVDRCKFLNFSCLGAELEGQGAKVVFSRFESNSLNYYTTGLSFQERYQTVSNCSFYGPLQGDATQFESNECSLINCFFAENIEGCAFYIGSATLNDNKIIGCVFNSESSLSASKDLGTKTVRYGNTPSGLISNTNNFLDEIQVHTGQPAIDSSVMVLSNSFTHNPDTDQDATTIIGKIDDAVEQIFEERNFTFELSDPVFDELGTCVSNYFTWDGLTNTFSWPDFLIRSVHKEAPIASFTSGSLVVPAGNICFFDFLDSTISTEQLISLDAPQDKKKLTLLTALPSPLGAALWREGHKLEAGSLNTFDIDGHLLAPTRFLGLSESRNPQKPNIALLTSVDKVDMTTQLGEQSQTVRLLYEKSNIEYNRETDDARISTEPTVGSWYASSDWSSGIPSAPTHLLNVQGTLYGLVPSSGLYYFDRSADGWRPLGGCPLTGPYCSISRWTTGLCLLSCSGQIVTYTPEFGWGAVKTPTKSAPLAALTLSSSSPANGWYDAGQADFALQTENYSLFTTVDGYTLRWYDEGNYIDLLPRVFTETAGTDQGLLSYHPKDTGYNMVLSKEDLCMTGDNGGFSRISGLPLSKLYNSEILVDTELVARETTLRLDWSTLVLENIAFTQPNGDFLLVAANSTRTTFYLLAGGRGTARLVSVIDNTVLGNNFSAQEWVLDPYTQTTYILGKSNNNEFIFFRGCWQAPTLESDLRWGAGKYIFTKSTVLGTNQCSRVYAKLDYYLERLGTGKLVALICDPSRDNRPTWAEYDPLANTWSIKYLTDQVPTNSDTIQVTNAISQVFDGSASVGFGVSSPYGMNFLLRSGSAFTNRACLIRCRRNSSSFEIVDAGGSFLTQCHGGVYHPAFKTVMWLGRSTSLDQFRLYSLFENASNTASIWDITTIGFGGTYLSGVSLGNTTFSRRSGSMIGVSANVFLGSSATDDVYFWTPARGLIRGRLGIGGSGFTSQSWSIVNARSNSDPLMFSSTPTNTYSCLLGTDRGGDLSLQFASFVESLPFYGFSMLAQADDYEGILWFDPGTVVKNLDPYIWAGLNRGGYLWVADTRTDATQYEYSPNTQIRGDVVVANMAAATDFDWAITTDNSKIGFCIRTSADLLFFYLYDVATKTLTVERQGADFISSVLVSSTPKMIFNSATNTFDIVCQDNSRLGGQLAFFQRNLSGLWTSEQVGSGSTNLSSLGSQACKKPSRPLAFGNGFLVVCESGSSAALVLRRDAVTGWANIWLSSTGGFTSPCIAKTTGSTTRYYVFGGISPGARSAVATSTTGTTGWSILINPTSSSVSVYTRVLEPQVFMSSDAVFVGSPLSAETGTTEAQEFGVFRFNNDGTVTGNAFAARSRLTGLQSGREESSYTGHSWTYKGDLLYAATRLNRSQNHWNIRRSLNEWRCVGESVVGSGRIIALDNRQYRECFVSASQSDTNVIVESVTLKTTSTLPLATRQENELWGLNWGGSQTFLFSYGSMLQMINDSSAPAGVLPSLGQRAWPRVIGTTQGILSGASVFGHGAGLRLLPPIGSINYFSTALPGNGLFRLKADCSISFYGTHRFRLADRNDKEYFIEGPLTFALSEPGQTLVFDFATPDSLKLDSSTAPLSYWLANNISKFRYPIVLGRNDTQSFVLSSIVGNKRLSHGQLEPREYSGLSISLDSRNISGYAAHSKYSFDQINTGAYGKFKVKMLGSNHGLQTFNMTDSAQKQLLLRGPLSSGFCFLSFRNDTVRSDALHFQPILTSQDTIVLLGL